MAKVNSEKLVAFLGEKWGGRSCPMCGKGPWNVQPTVFQLNEFHEGSFVVGGPLVPVIPVSCGNCGHTVLVNAIISGAMAQQEPVPEKK